MELLTMRSPFVWVRTNSARHQSAISKSRGIRVVDRTQSTSLENAQWKRSFGVAGFLLWQRRRDKFGSSSGQSRGGDDRENVLQRWWECAKRWQGARSIGGGSKTGRLGRQRFLHNYRAIEKSLVRLSTCATVHAPLHVAPPGSAYRHHSSVGGVTRTPLVNKSMTTLIIKIGLRMCFLPEHSPLVVGPT